MLAWTLAQREKRREEKRREERDREVGYNIRMHMSNLSTQQA